MILFKVRPGEHFADDRVQHPVVPGEFALALMCGVFYDEHLPEIIQQRALVHFFLGGVITPADVAHFNRNEIYICHEEESKVIFKGHEIWMLLNLNLMIPDTSVKKQKR